MNIWRSIVAMIEAQGRAALVTLDEVAGSSPREAGARMAVRPDGALAGTIGGGTLEWMALADAQRLLSSGTPRGEQRVRALGPDLGQCCGGRVRVRIETFDRDDLPVLSGFAAPETLTTAGTQAADGRLARALSNHVVPAGARLVRRADGTTLETFGTAPTPLLLFGAGHVGRALVQALAPLPVAVTWVDPRVGAFPDQVPLNVRAVVSKDPVQTIREAISGSLVAVMTHSHALDLDLVAAVLSRPDLPYVGLIGSDTKRARFVSSLARMGLGPERLVCPIGGKALADKSPAVIAAQIAVEVLMVRESLGAQAHPFPARGERDEPRPAAAGQRHD
jgi:xanthine dehydrogenase accessory factor